MFVWEFREILDVGIFPLHQDSSVTLQCKVGNPRHKYRLYTFSEKALIHSRVLNVTTLFMYIMLSSFNRV